MDVLQCYEHFFPAVQPKAKGRGAHGKEWGAACPVCGGEDRLCLWPEHDAGQGGRYWCRQCDAKGDAIDFLRNFQGMTYKAACDFLRLTPKDYTTKNTRQKHDVLPWQPKAEAYPPAVWMERAAAFVDECVRAGEAGQGRDALAARGITAETASRLGFGWNTTDRYESRSAWGMPEELNPDTGRPRKVWIPRGLVLPIMRNGVGVVALLLRRADWKAEDSLPKYWQVRGSMNASFCEGKQGLPVLVVESIIDAALCLQAASEFVGVVALVGASKKPDAYTTDFLRQAQAILLSLDFDGAGKKALPWWKKTFPRARLWPVAAGKDHSEMAAAGISIRQWVMLGVKPYLQDKTAINDKASLPAETPTDTRQDSKLYLPAVHDKGACEWTPCATPCRDMGGACLACQNLVGIEEGRQCFSCYAWQAGRGRGRGYFLGQCLKDKRAAHMMMPCRWGSVADDELLLSC